MAATPTYVIRTLEGMFLMEDESAKRKNMTHLAKGWREAAEKGQIPRSQDFASAAVIVCGAAGLIFGSVPMQRQVERVYNRFLDGRGPYTFTLTDAIQWQWEVMEILVLATYVPLGVILIGVIVANLSQTGFQIASKALNQISRSSIFLQASSRCTCRGRLGWRCSSHSPRWWCCPSFAILP